jgi:predicted TIM-barrel fold metal-dependent hydrolase
MIIDAHAHLGTCRVFDLDVSEHLLLEKLESNGVDALIVQPFPGAPDPAAVHNRIAALAERHPGGIYGLASLNPHIGHDAYRAELTRCVRDLGFVGVPIVLAHGGYGIFGAEALTAAQMCANVFIEPSWAPSSGIAGMIRTLGADRVLFGSDMPINQAPELAKYRTIGLSESELDACLWRTAAQVFKLRVAAAA